MTWKTLGVGDVRDGLYQLRDFEGLKDSSQQFFVGAASSGPNKEEEQFDIWHYKLGHPSPSKRIADINIRKS